MSQVWEDLFWLQILRDLGVQWIIPDAQKVVFQQQARTQKQQILPKIRDYQTCGGGAL
jgi:hypothetical protein